MRLVSTKDCGVITTGQFMGIDYSQMPLAKPGNVVKLKGLGYTTHKRRVWERQGRSCADCARGLAFNQMELHHESRVGFAGKISHGRGLGGGKRNDLKTRGLCHWCHTKAEEAKR